MNYTKNNPLTSAMLVLALLTALLVPSVARAGVSADTTIVGGNDATYGDHPYIGSLQVASGSSWFHICGVVLYNANYAVSAAHCLTQAASNYRVIFGLHRMNNSDSGEQARTLTSYTNHPQYNGNAAGYPNDIAILRLSSPVNFGTYVQPVSFATGGSFAGQNMVVSGWGRLTGGGATPNPLQEVNMTKITNSECTNHWSGISGATINSEHLCGYNSSANPPSACSGDNGGPARVGNTLVGIVSWGISSCSGAYPTVFTRVSAFSSWLQSNAGGQSFSSASSVAIDENSGGEEDTSEMSDFLFLPVISR